MRKKYMQVELNKALDLIEQGYSYSEVENDMALNKSILAREMRKRKNEKANKAIKDCSQALIEDDYRTFNEYRK